MDLNTAIQLVVTSLLGMTIRNGINNQGK
jgi:hypothetical protein